MQASKKPLIRNGDDGKWDIFFDPEAMPAIRTYMSILQEGITPQKAIGLSGSSQDEAFFQGTAALAQRAYFNISVLHDNYPDFKFAVMPIPMQPGSTYYSNNAGQGFVVPVVSTHKAEAAEFAFWFQKPENQALWTSALYLAPCNPKALDDPLIKGNPDFQALRFYKSIEKIVDVPVSVNQNEFVTTIYAPAMMDALMGKITLDEAMQQIKKASKEMLNK
jgi:multiple sugar transport system substrate-binding protein